MINKLKKIPKRFKPITETITAVASVIKLILVATVTLILALVVSNTAFNKKEEQYLAEMRKYKAKAESTSQYADSMAVEVVKQQTIIKAAQARATAAQLQVEQSRAQTAVLASRLAAVRAAANDSTEMARLIIPKQDSIIAQQEVTIAFQDTTILNLNAVSVGKDTTINLLTLSRDSLQKVVNNIPTPPPPPPFPTIKRKHAFAIGVVVGFAAKVFLF